MPSPAKPAESLESIALVVAATVVSHGTRGGFLVDAGAKALAKDVAPFLVGHGSVLGYPDAVLTRSNDHHGIAEVPAGSPRPRIGEVVLIVPNHACPVVNLVDELVVVQGGQVVDRWPRGRPRPEQLKFAGPGRQPGRGQQSSRLAAIRAG